MPDLIIIIKIYCHNSYHKGPRSTVYKLDTFVKVRKNLHTTVRLQLSLFSKITGAFLFQAFGGFLHVPITQTYCLTGTIISETHIIIIIMINNTTQSSTAFY